MSKTKTPGQPSRLLVGVLSAALAFPAVVPVAYAQSSQQAGVAQLSQAQLAALVAPIALYPDPLVSQVLMASTYPLQVAEASNWQKANSGLKGSALNQALQQQNWDASVKSLVSFPPVLGMMGSELNWTQNLGNAVLAQQSDVMAAIQDLRAKAQQSGALQSNSQQTVSGGGNAPIVIQPANPQVVYVPTYNPAVVYGGWPYPSYPPYSYYPPGYVAGTALLSFGVGMAVGAALWGGCHWGGGWGGGNSLTVNNNTLNNFNRGTSNSFKSVGSGTGNWKPSAAQRSSAASAVQRDAQRDNLRQDLQKNGLNTSSRGSENRTEAKNADQNFGQKADREDAQNMRQKANENEGRVNSDRSDWGQSFGKDSGGFGDTRGAKFNSGDRFGGGGGGRSFGGRR